MSNYNTIDSHELVLSKENIQPLRRGRDTSILCAALQAETHSDAQQGLEKQRNEFEVRLRSGNNEDPLTDWCDYVRWIEQSFPKQPREGKLNVVLRKCITKFKDCEHYMNDVRFVKLCIKYADIEENTVELLSQIHRHGIGVSCAELYIAWAEKYAVDNCYKKANAIYERGLQCSAQPLELLQEAYRNFQSFLVRKMLNERETFQPTVLDSNSADVRQPYNTLQTVSSVTGSNVVPSIRVGSNVLGTAGKLQQNRTTEQKPKNNTMVKIFEDSENKFSSAEPKAKIEKLRSKKALSKENTIKPGKWTNKESGLAPFTVDAPAIVPFQVHRDENTEETNKRPQNVPSSVLKSHKVKTWYEDDNFATAPLFYAEPYDPTKLPMYCKEQVYAGGLEFQFEELRAMQFRRKREEMISKQNNVAKSIRSESPQTVSKQDSTSSVYKAESLSQHKSETKKIKPTDSGERSKLGNNESRRRTLFSNPVALSEPIKNNYVPEENLPNSEQSMTIHTKEALSEIQQLWFSRPASPVSIAVNKPIAKSILKPSKPCFSLYVDESCLGNLKNSDEAEKPLDLTVENNSGQNNPSKDTANKISNQIYVENENAYPQGGVRKKTNAMNVIKPSDNCKENVYVPADVCPSKKLTSEFEKDDEDKENGIPQDYCGPVGKSTRKVSGILTPAENIEIAPLSDEEVEIDEDDDQDFFSGIQCNTTGITETWNFTKGFQFPRGESTPNVRKSFVNKEELNESVFVPEPNDNVQAKSVESDSKCTKSGEKFVTANSHDKKASPRKGENFTRNLSVIAETTREYKSSTSGSSGTSTLTFRSSKNFPHTPLEMKNSKHSLTSSQTTLQKTKIQSCTGYEASNEFSQTALKTPNTDSKKLVFHTTFDLMEKLNAIESISIDVHGQEEVEVERVSENMNKLEIEEKDEENLGAEIDPFDDEMIKKFLQDVDFPRSHHENGYFLLDDIYLAPPKVGSTTTLGAHTYNVKKLLGEGAFGKVYKLQNTWSGEQMVGKFQKSLLPWEFYIAREVQNRLQNKSLASFFMEFESGYFFKNSSILLTRPVEFGDLLSVINKMKQGKIMSQILAMYFTCQILEILEALHNCNIIHGDIKPDNFLLKKFNNKLQVQLIDFGQSVDLSLFPENTKFTKVVTTEGVTTREKKTGVLWLYQLDFCGIANCAHCLLFGEYIKVTKKNGVSNITKIIPRYWARTEWKNFFNILLNVESCSQIPSLSKLRDSFNDILVESSEFEVCLIKLNNLLNDR